MISDFPDGIIEVDSPLGKELGFTSQRFVKDFSYLFKEKGFIYVSNIMAVHPRTGCFRELCLNIEKQGFGIKVPTPFARMRDILRKNGYTETKEWSEEVGENCEIWKKEARQ